MISRRRLARIPLSSDTFPFGRGRPSRPQPSILAASSHAGPAPRRLLFATAAAVVAIASQAQPAHSQTVTASYTGAAQTFSIQTTGSYAFTIAGAKGGNGTLGSAPLQGAAGAIIIGTYTLNAGAVLNIIAGGQGGSAPGYGGGGGGGGSFVYNTTTSQLIAVAGGGGGGGSQSGGASGGQITTDGGWGGGSGAGAGGVNGNGGQANPNDHGGGGGGFLTAGQNSSSATGGRGYPTLTGGANPRGSAGGFGGGGASSNEGGGGGGYSGGGGGSGFLHYGGGGGGSFQATGFTLTSATAGSNGGAATPVGNFGNGYVSFYLLYAAPVPNSPSSMGGGGTFLASSLGGSTLPAFDGGVLQIDQEGKTFAQGFTLGASGANTIDQSGRAVTFSGVLSDAAGAGSITIANGASGGGVTFGGVNTYTGATAIGDGASLALSGGGSIARSSAVIANGVFDISAVSRGQADITSLAGSGQVNLGAVTLNISQASGVFSGGFAGTGGLSVSGGVQTLSGVSQVSSTTIAGGALVVTGALTSAFTVGGGGTLQGDAAGLRAQGGIVNNGTLVFDQTGGGAFTNAITGSGALVKQGAGALVLSGASSAGSTTVSAGSLIVAGPLTSVFTVDSGAVLQADTTSLLAQGRVANNGTLVFDQAAYGVFANDIAGSGRLAKQNTGLLVLNGVSALGQTTVTGGNLQIGDMTHESAQLTSAVTVGPAATLSGHGKVIGAVANNGGTVSPGGSIGILTIDGAYTQTSSGVLSIEIDPRVSSQLLVTGLATLGGKLELLAVPGTYRAGTRYTLVTAGAMAGAFAQAALSNNLPFTVTASGATQILTLGGGTFQTAGATPNQVSAGMAFVNVPVGRADFDKVADVLVNLPTAAQERAAFESAGAEISTQTARQGRVAQRSFMGVLTDQLFAESQAGREPGAWGRAFGGSGTVEGDRGAHEATSDGGGAVLGGSTSLGPNSTVGAIFGYHRAKVSLKGLSQSGDVQAYGLGVYGEHRMGAWFVDAAATVGVSDGDSHRTIAFGAIARVAEGSFDGTSVAGLVSAGARWRRPGGLVVEPSLSLVASRVTQGGYTETGAGDLDLVVAKARDSSVQARLGVRAAKPLVLHNGTRLNIEGGAAWVEELGDGAPTIRTAFSAAPANGFTLAGARPGSSAIVVGAGATYALSSRMNLYGRYDESHNDNGADRQATVGLRWAW